MPFERRLVKLAWMAWLRSAAGKHHRPGHIGRPAPQFAVDEIGDAAEKQPDGRRRAGEVAERQKRDVAKPRKQKDHDQTADEAAVERHAALPELEDFERVLDEIRQIVEQHIAGAAAEDDAQGHPQHEVVEVDDGERSGPAPQALGLDQRPCIQPAEQDADDIGERVPPNRDRPEADQHRVECRKRNGEKRHGSGPASSAA